MQCGECGVCRTCELRADRAALRRKVEIGRREGAVLLDAKSGRVEDAERVLRVRLALCRGPRVVRDRFLDVHGDALAAEVHVAEMALGLHPYGAIDDRVVGRVREGLEQRDRRARPLAAAVGAAAERGHLAQHRRQLRRLQLVIHDLLEAFERHLRVCEVLRGGL